MSVSIKQTNKPLGVFSLTMMNIIAVDSLRSLPIAAQFGYALIFFYFLAAIFFFIPIAFITAQLVKAYPTPGGAYTWIRLALGSSWGWFAAWLQWIYNVVWYPVVLSFVIAAFGYLINPHFTSHKLSFLAAILAIWWFVIGLNCFGLRVSSRFSTIGALLGNLIPILFMIGLASIWVKSSKPLAIHLSIFSLFPNLKDFNNISFFTTVVFGLMGLEMSAIYVGNVKSPEKDYSKALFWSTNLILLTLILGSLSVALIVPTQQLTLLSGLTEAYVIFFKQYHLTFFIPITIGLIIIGCLCNISTWTLGPTQGLYIATLDSQLFALKWLLKMNRFRAPVGLLLLQGVFVSLLCGLFILIPNINESYWLLSVMTAQLAVLFYVFLFLSVFRLENVLSKGKYGLLTALSLGLIGCTATFVIGFFPPANVSPDHFLKFDILLLLGIFLFCLPPVLWILLSSYNNKNRSNGLKNNKFVPK